MRKKILFTIVVLGVIALITLKLLFNTQAANNEIKAEQAPVPFTVEAIPAQVRTFNESFTYPGALQASEIVKVLTESDGRVVKLNVAKGDMVKTGQSVAVLDNKLKLKNYQLNQINFEKAKVDLDRLKALYQENNATKVELETAIHAYKNAEKQLQIAKDELNYLSIKAPINGIIVEKLANVGDVVAVNAPITTIAMLQQMEILVHVPEKDITSIKKGSKVDFSVDAYPGRIFQGTITAIIPVGNEGRIFPVYVKASNNQNGLQLMAGMAASVNFNMAKKKTALAIPRSAIRGDLSAPYVWIINDQLKVIKRFFKPGNVLGEYIEVLSGITADEKVITKGHSNVTEGMKLPSYKTANADTTSISHPSN